MYLFSSLFAAVALFSAPSLQFLEVETIYQFPNPTWLENIHTTRSGFLLTGIIGVPELHLVDPSRSPATASLAYTFPGVTSIFGIADIGTDEYAVIAGNFSFETGTGGAFSVWSVDLKNRRSKPSARKLADFPNAKLLNGMTALDHQTLLIADSSAGHVLKLDSVTGKYSVSLDHPSMKPVPGAALDIGINGVKIHNSHLYYTNTFGNSITRVKIDRNGKAVGRFETISDKISIPDDFAITNDGDVIVGRPFANVVDRVKLNGRIERLAGNLNSSVVAGTTAVTLGRTRRTANIAYVCTNGGQSTPVNGVVEGGKIVAIRLR